MGTHLFGSPCINATCAGSTKEKQHLI